MSRLTSVEVPCSHGRIPASCTAITDTCQDCPNTPWKQRSHTVTLASGETHNISHDEVLRQLRELHEWYSGQEKDWYVKTYNGEGAFNPAYEREWLKYRGEAAALQVAINILSAGQPR